MRSGVRGRIILFLAVAALAVMLWPAITGNAILGFRDMLHNYGPMRQLFWSGRVSLWNDRAFGGSSVLANIVQQPFYLGNLMMRALSAPAWPGIPIRVGLHSVEGMVATYWFLRRQTSEDAAGLGAAMFGLCGFSIANFSNPQWAVAAMWAPVVLLAFDLWAVEGGVAAGCLLALALPQPLLAGDPQLFVLMAATGFGFALLRRKRPGKRLFAEGALIAAAVALIASPQVVTSLRALPEIARREGLPREIREQWSLHPARIAELFVPRMFGPAFEAGFWGGFTVSPPWSRNYVHSVYAGLIGPALFFSVLRSKRREALPWLMVAGVALLLSLGAHFFHLYGVLGDWLPFFNVFRYPQRLMALFMPAWAVLLALGAAEIVKLDPRARVRLAAGATALAGAALLVTALLAHPDRAALWRSGIQIAAVGTASCLAMLLPARHALLALSAVLIVDLAVANRELLGLLPRGPFRAPPAACDALDGAAGNDRRSSFRVYVDQDPLSEAPSPDWALQRIREYNFGKRNLLEVCGYHQSVSLTSLDPAGEMRLWREVSPLRMLRVMGTRFVITAPNRASLFGGRELSVDPLWDFAVVELPDPLPLLFRPEQVEGIPSAQLTAAARERPELLGVKIAALAETPRPHFPDPAARLVSSTNHGDEMFFRARQARPGYWVIGATFDQDWRAEVDGAAVPIVQSDLVRRAIWVPPGDHLVALRYRPLLPLSLFAVSALLTMALAWSAARGFLQRQNAPAEESASPSPAPR